MIDEIINLPLLKSPVNWATILLMVIIASMVFDLVMQWHGQYFPSENS